MVVSTHLKEYERKIGSFPPATNTQITYMIQVMLPLLTTQQIHAKAVATTLG